MSGRTPPPAGWYADPAYDGWQRYWDGAQWAERRPADQELSRPAAQKRRAAGWYDDPSMVNTRRYWDGEKWTEHRQERPPQAAAAPPLYEQEEHEPFTAMGLDWAMMFAIFIAPVGFLLGLWMLGSHPARAWRVIAVSIGVTVLVVLLNVYR